MKATWRQVGIISLLASLAYELRMARDPYPSEMQDRFIVRMPDGLRGRIALAAKRNGRSMNSEIVAALEERYPAPAVASLAELAERIEVAAHDLAASGKGRDALFSLLDALRALPEASVDPEAPKRKA